MKRRSLLLAAGAPARRRDRRRLLALAGDPVARAATPVATSAIGCATSKPSDWPAPSAEYTTDVAIVGSGVAGLTAAWRLAREGHTRFALVTGPEPHGNAASGSASVGGERLRYPTGAHYLPLPSMESTHVRTMLADFGVLQDGADSATPTYDERVVVHAPDERLYRDGRWQEGLVPADAVDGPAVRCGTRPAARPAAEGSAIDRFFRVVETLRDARGADGRKVFAVPVALSSADPRWTALDAIPFATWLAREGHDDPALRWYLDYCCRDDYGANAADVSAWAGLHYFAARNGQASNAERGAVLTWPEGLDALADRLEAGAFAPRAGRPAPQRLAGTALSIRETRVGVDVLCVGARRGVDRSSSTRSARSARCRCSSRAHVVDALKDDAAWRPRDPRRTSRRGWSRTS